MIKIDHEKLIQELHAHDTRNCPEPLKLEDRPDFIRRYYEDVVEVVCQHIAVQAGPPPRRLVWEGCCDRCGHKARFETGGVKSCKWGRCNGEVRPRIVEL